MSSDSHLPYSKKGLEGLAAVLGVHSAFLWVNPSTQRLDIKRVEKHHQFESEQGDSEEEIG